MKKEQLYEVLGDINEEYVNEAHMTTKKISRPVWLKWGTMAACLALVVMVATVAMPTMFKNSDTPPTVGTEYKDELGLGKSYVYSIDEGRFSAYASGKVISEDKIGEKIEDVSITAGWRNNAEMSWISQETLQGEVYLIDGVSSDTAVALKFLDKGEAITTTHYYVILNPNADWSAVEEYVIAPIVPNNPSDE